MNCKEFKTTVEEGLKSDSLSIAAQDHAAGCPPCHKFNQKHVEFREWLTVCKTISAPKDFQFGVQRKIASGNSVHSNEWLWSGLRYIVPSAAVVTVLVLSVSFFINYNNVSDGKIQGAISDPEIGNAVAANVAKVNNLPQEVQPANATEEQPKSEEAKIAAANTNKAVNNARTTPPGGTLDSSKGNGGVVDQGLGNSKPPELPEGLHLPSSSASGLSEKLMSLRSFGVLASTDLRVNGLKLGSAAERSGVKVGDIVESLSGNVVTIRRGGEILRITLK